MSIRAGASPKRADRDLRYLVSQYHSSLEAKNRKPYISPLHPAWQKIVYS